MENAISLIGGERAIRFGIFLVVFCVLAVMEIIAPKRPLLTSKPRRWSANLTIITLNPLSVALIFPVLPAGLALFASKQHWGLLNQLAMPYWNKVVIGVILLDLTIYAQHVLHHAIPVLWRLQCTMPIWISI